MNPEIGPGHNIADTVAGEQLRALIERIENVEGERAALAADVKDIYAEAKSHGFDTKIMRKIVALRKKDAAQRAEEEAVMALYLEALGDLASTPLGEAALKAAWGR